MWRERGREGRLASNITMDAEVIWGGLPAFCSRSAGDAGWMGKEMDVGISVCDRHTQQGKGGGKGREQPSKTYMPWGGG